MGGAQVIGAGAARRHVAHSVNTAMVQAYWLIGREIVEVEQHGETRAGYGERLLEGFGAARGHGGLGESLGAA